MRTRKANKMTAITQVHCYIKEHCSPGDIISVCCITKNLQHLTYSSVSASLWKLGQEELLIPLEEKGRCGSNEYMVNDNIHDLRGHENRNAPPQGVKRSRSKKTKPKPATYTVLNYPYI